MSNQDISIIPTGDGQYLAIAGGRYRILISGEATDGAYAVIEMQVPPGGGPGPHAHKDVQEMFYVADGEVEFKMEGGKQQALKGALVNIPLGGKVHCFKNTSDQIATLICTVVPAGLDRFFQEIGKPAAAGQFLPPQPPTPEAMARIKALGEQYGQEFYPPDYLG